MVNRLLHIHLHGYKIDLSMYVYVHVYTYKYFTTPNPYFMLLKVRRFPLIFRPLWINHCQGNAIFRLVFFPALLRYK